LAGNIAARAAANEVFAETHSLNELTTIKAAKSNSALWLERLAARTARDWPTS
jgi:hypothetical protein